MIYNLLQPCYSHWSLLRILTQQCRAHVSTSQHIPFWKFRTASWFLAEYLDLFPKLHFLQEFHWGYLEIFDFVLSIHHIISYKFHTLFRHSWWKVIALYAQSLTEAVRHLWLNDLFVLFQNVRSTFLSFPFLR